MSYVLLTVKRDFTLRYYNIFIPRLHVASTHPPCPTTTTTGTTILSLLLPPRTVAVDDECMFMIRKYDLLLVKCPLSSRTTPKTSEMSAEAGQRPECVPFALCILNTISPSASGVSLHSIKMSPWWQSSAWQFIAEHQRINLHSCLGGHGMFHWGKRAVKPPTNYTRLPNLVRVWTYTDRLWHGR